MKPIYIREQHRYEAKELCEKFLISLEELTGILKRLKEFGILKTIRRNAYSKDLTELLDEDIKLEEASANDSDSYFVFTFVGVLMIERFILNCYPKYIFDKDIRPKDELKQVVKVIEKINQKEQSINLFIDFNNRKSYNELSVILFLLNDYFEHGIYSTRELVYEVNGEGEVNWEKTINEKFTVLSNNRSFYPELITKKMVSDDYHILKRLHEIILSECSQNLKDADLLDLFDFVEVDLTDENFEDIGEIDYLLYVIEQSLSIEFNTRRQLLLKALYVYLSEKNLSSPDGNISFFGTNAFHVVWEKVCAHILGNDLHISIGNLGLDADSSKLSLKLIDYIEKPKWQTANVTRYSKDTLIPDTISVRKPYFFIFDAKYYTLQVEEQLRNYPGIGDITKQFLYQRAYKNLIVKNHLIAKNCFVVPTSSESDYDYVRISMDMFSDLKPEYIQVMKLNASQAYDYYLKGKILDEVFLHFVN